MPGLAGMKFIPYISMQVVSVHLSFCGAIWIDCFYLYVPSMLQHRFSVVLGYTTFILQALLFARHCYIGPLGMPNKQYSSQYRDKQLAFLLLGLLPYPFPSSPFKVWLYWGRGNLLLLWDNNMLYNESLSQDGTSSVKRKTQRKILVGSLKWRVFWENKTKKASKGWQH